MLRFLSSRRDRCPDELFQHQQRRSFTDVETPVSAANSGGSLNCVVPSLTLDGSRSSAGGNFSLAGQQLWGNILSGADTLTPTVDAAEHLSFASDQRHQ
ncbi:MAG: hypothetical protein R2788_10295 [Saprospiraceae bacterium]